MLLLLSSLAFIYSSVVLLLLCSTMSYYIMLYTSRSFDVLYVYEYTAAYNVQLCRKCRTLSTFVFVFNFEMVELAYHGIELQSLERQVVGRVHVLDDKHTATMYHTYFWDSYYIVVAVGELCFGGHSTGHDLAI